ncbi:MAG: DUF4355 domain-containing protein [Ruminiclostridium sp.]|nr:DUF4355 domain-containing protein [Ruminiclostridium sp.]
MAFEPIETQEAFDAAIKSRIERNTKSVTDEVTKKYEGYISPEDASKQTAELNKQIKDLTAKLGERDSSIADLTAKNKAYETASVKTRIAREFNIPYELADRLSGETEDDIKKDAEKLSAFVGRKKTAPLFDLDTGSGKDDSAYKNLLKSIRKD